MLYRYTLTLVLLETPVDQHTDLVTFLLRTYSFYVDRQSRQAVQRCLSASLSGSNARNNFPIIATFLQNEIAKPVIAPSSIYTLLQWCSLALQQIARTPELWHLQGIKVTRALGVCLEKFLGVGAKESRTHSAHVTTRRALRSLCKSEDLCDRVLRQIVLDLTSEESSLGPRNAPLLGVLAGVATRIPDVRSIIMDQVPLYHAFYTREIIGSRTPLPDHVVNGLKDFFLNFEALDAFQRDVVPAIEKTLLRAPEIVLQNMIPCLAGSLPLSLDLSTPLRRHLLKPLLSSAKSSNPTIREGALKAFEACVERSKNDEDLSAISDEVLKSAKDAKPADQRTILTSMLASAHASCSVASKVVNGITPLISKEANEGALRGEATAVGRHVYYQLSDSQEVDQAVIKLFTQGLQDKKVSVRRIWALEAAELLWPFVGKPTSPSVTSFAQNVFASMISTWDEALANPVPAVQSGAATIAFILFAFSLSNKESGPPLAPVLDKITPRNTSKSSNDKLSFVFNHRVYAKLSSEVDLRWFVRALAASGTHVEELPIESGLSWALSIIFAIVSHSVKATVRIEACNVLTSCYMNAQKHVSDVLVRGLWLWLQHIYQEERDSPATSAQAGLERLNVVVRCICVPKERFPHCNVSSSNHQMIALLVLCRTPLIPRTKWIELCLRVGIDPRDLVAAEPEYCLREIEDRTSVRTCHSSAEIYH